MSQLLELLPLVIFVSIYGLKGDTIDLAGFHHQFDGIYDATAALMATTVLQVLIVWLWKKQVEKRLWWLLAAVLIFGTATLVLHNQLFIQWKPTIFNWALCLVLLGSHWFTSQNLIQRMLGQQLQIPPQACTRMTYVWAGYFFLVGALNLVVAYHFSEAFWVKYKLYSSIGFTLVIAVVTGVMLSPYIQDSNTADAVNDTEKP